MKKQLLLLISALFIPITLLLFRSNTNVKFTGGDEGTRNGSSSYKSVEVELHPSNKTISMNLEAYIKGVVAAEMPATFEMEALKAQAVAARTYTIKKLMDGEKLTTDYKVCQAYKDEASLKKLWGDDYGEYSKRIDEAVRETKGEVVSYEGKPIQAVFHSMSGGYTRSSQGIWNFSLPYLVPVDSSVDTYNQSYEVVNSFSFKELESKLEGYKASEEIKSIRKDDKGYVTWVQVGNKNMAGEKLRMALGLPSSNMTILRTSTGYDITTRGYGHGVGMSQNGANELAKQGKDYQYILNYYYQGTKLAKDMYIAPHLWQ